jgi:hypothetical protein
MQNAKTDHPTLQPPKPNIMFDLLPTGRPTAAITPTAGPGVNNRIKHRPGPIRPGRLYETCIGDGDQRGRRCGPIRKTRLDDGSKSRLCPLVQPRAEIFSVHALLQHLNDDGEGGDDWHRDHARCH